MKRLLLLVFIAVFSVGFSQSEEKMKFINTHSVEYNGKKIKEAKIIAKEKESKLAFKEFRRAQFYRAGSIYLDFSFFASYIVLSQLLCWLLQLSQIILVLLIKKRNNSLQFYFNSLKLRFIIQTYFS